MASGGGPTIVSTSTLPVIALFRSHYSIGQSLLTLAEAGKEKPGNPASVFTLAKRANLTHVHIVDSKIDGFIEAYRSSLKEGIQLCFGLKLVIVPDMTDKGPESRRGESNAIVMVTGGAEGYRDLLRIHNRAWTDGMFDHRGSRYGRADWKLIKTFWTERLGLALPWYSSFIAKNTLTFSSITPDLPTVPWVFKEMATELPFAPLIDAAIDRYLGKDTSKLVPVKTICYDRRADFRPYVVLRCIHERSSFSSPNVDHLSSDAFSMQAWEELLTVVAAPSAT